MALSSDPLLQQLAGGVARCVGSCFGNPSRERRPIGKQAAFTLVELLVVLVIIGLLMSVATLSLKGPYQAAQLQNACEQMQLIDRQLRDHGRRYSAASDLLIDLDSGTLETRQRDQESGDGLYQGLPRSIRVDRVVTARGQTQAGRVTIHFSPLGQTRTYAVRLRNSAGGTRWVIFAGVTGESRFADQTYEITPIFDILASARPDAA